MKDAHAAIDYIIKQSDEYAEAKSLVTYLEHYRKSKKAICFQNSMKNTMAEKEADAYSNPEYQELLLGIREATKNAEKLRWMLIAAQARIDVLRTQEASNRFLERVTT
jgi:cell fate (sporulation/competence/biofilm development) regulator YlbF (YheA/YmcA/DUF963 family)